MTVEEAAQPAVEGEHLADESYLICEMDHQTRQVNGWLRGEPVELDR